MPSRKEFKERIGSLPIAASEVVKLVDDIVDHYENQKCETCKWYYNKWLCTELDREVKPTFSCNKWEVLNA